ncbi:MAG TPA: S8 family peptidase [Solirubrobacteraceae bacterium]|nr:S8 family peptidase [Solirubrobacteraceae bacterium]
MASIIHGRLRLPAHIRLSVVALVGMVGLVWLLFFGMAPRLHPTALRTGGPAPAAGASGAANAPGVLSPSLAHLAATSPSRRVVAIIQLKHGTDLAAGRALVRSVGGRPGPGLSIINGLSATLTAADARTLAQSAHIHAVSLNSVLRSTWWRGTPAPWQLSTTYDQSVHATGLWRHSTGRGVGVAVIDTGITGDVPDFRTSAWNPTSRVIASAVVDPNASTAADTYGHGTAVAGLVAGNGHDRHWDDPLANDYAGSAPNANLISIKVADDNGQATTLDALYGLQFAVDHKNDYNIRVINMSFRSTDAESYTTDPLDAAAEQAWFDGITVVAAAGNMGTASDAVDYAPGNDPYVITVGAVDDQGTADNSDDVVADWSSQGTTQDGFAKPDVVAPGAHIISTLAPNSDFATLCPSCVIDGSYFQISGTSLAAPIVAGVAADLIAAHPDWTPAMVKGALVNTATQLPDGAAEVNAQAANWAGSDQLISDQGLTPNNLIDPDSGTIDYNAASWSAGSWSTAADPLAASWSAASWSCVDCSAGASSQDGDGNAGDGGDGDSGDGGGVDPTSASWSTVGWTTFWG